VFRVQAQLRSPTGRQRAASFVVKLAHGEARRELTMYRALEAHAGEALAPRLLGVAHASATDRTGRNTVIPRPCASWAKDECGCRRRAPRCRAVAAVWSLQTIVYILIDVVLFRYPPAVLRGLGVRDGVLAGPARGEATRFQAILAEYQQAPEVTRRRLHLEALGRFMTDMKGLYIVDSDQKAMVPWLALDSGPQDAGPKATAGGR
jgi:hypothetical protein